MFTDQQAVQIVSDALKRAGAAGGVAGGTPQLKVQSACDHLVESVLRSGRCTDNVTVVLVVFDRARRGGAFQAGAAA